MRNLLLVFALLGCARPAPSSPSASAGSSSVADTPQPTERAAALPELPAEDEAVRRWKAIIADQFRPPAGSTAAQLVPELMRLLRSPDPARRDGIAFEVLDHWIRKQVLTDAEVRSLAERLVGNLRGGLDVPDGVFERSFSALVLASVVARDAATPFLRDEDRRALLTAARDYAHRETDLRGYTGVRGWAHAAAHTADLLAQLAKLPVFTDDDRAIMLEAVSGFIVRRHGEILHYGEDGRLGVAVISAAKRGLARPALTAWLASIKAPLAERGGPAFDAGRYAAQRNARNLLFTLYVQASLATEPKDGERRLLEAVRTALSE